VVPTSSFTEEEPSWERAVLRERAHKPFLDLQELGCLGERQDLEEPECSEGVSAQRCLVAFDLERQGGPIELES
jgi:hypothetical protein